MNYRRSSPVHQTRCGLNAHCYQDDLKVSLSARVNGHLLALMLIAREKETHCRTRQLDERE